MARSQLHITLPNGQKVKATGETVNDAVTNFMKKYVHLYTSTPAVSVEAPTFKDCFEKWFDLYHNQRVRENTGHKDKSVANKHVLPVFGNKRMNEITRDDIQAFFNTKRDYAESTCNKMYFIIHGTFKHAAKNGYIQTDITTPKKDYILSKTKTDRKALEDEQVAEIVNAIPKLQPHDQLLVAMFCFSGVRLSEALALNWEYSIDFKRNMIHVKDALYWDKTDHNAPKIGKTKSKAGVRDIPIVPDLLPHLKANKRADGWLFPDEPNRNHKEVSPHEPMREYTYKQKFKRINKTIDLHGATAHVFRHTFATMAVDKIDTKTLQAVIGDSTHKVVMDTYVHPRQAKIAAAGTQLSNLYGTTQAMTQT